ncbi:MAG: PASTA domain-containing protein [Acidobacteriota bacterium]
MWRTLARGFGCLGYLAVLGVIFSVVGYIAFSIFVRGGVTSVPDLKGLDEGEGLALLVDQGLRAAITDDRRFDERVPKGHVLIQEPRAGVYVKRNTEVALTLSKGPRRIEVPSVLGQAVQAAQVSLAASSLAVGRIYEVQSIEGRRGAVVAQHPGAGERVEIEAPVDLFIAVESNAEVYVMPDLVKRNFEDVRSFFAARGVRLGRVSYETYAGVAPGTVLRQFPLAGHPLHKEDVISLAVVAPEPTSAEEDAPASSAPDADAQETSR